MHELSVVLHELSCVLYCALYCSRVEQFQTGCLLLASSILAVETQFELSIIICWLADQHRVLHASW